MLCVSKPPLGRAVDAALEAVTSMCCAGNWAPWGAEPVCWRKDPEHTEWYEEDLRSFVPLFVHFLFKPQSSQQLQQKKKTLLCSDVDFLPWKNPSWLLLATPALPLSYWRRLDGKPSRWQVYPQPAPICRVLLPICHATEIHLEAMLLGWALCCPFIHAPYCVFARPLLPNNSEN